MLDDGLIVERGDHATLLRKNGLYASMWNRQRVVQEAEERLRKVEEDEDEPLPARRHAGEGAGGVAGGRPLHSGGYSMLVSGSRGGALCVYG